MNYPVYLYIAVMAIVTYLIRVLPLTLIKQEIKNPFIRSFSGAAALIAALILAYKGKSLFQVSIVACAVVFILEFFV